MFTHVAGRIDTRFFIQVIDFQTGVISKYDLSGKVTDSRCLDDCIFFKRTSVFFNISCDSGILQGKKLDIQITENFADLLHFSFIAGGKNYFFHLFAFLLGGFGPRN